MLTLQNGVENEALLCEVFPRDQVMGGNARVGAEITAPGKLLHTVGGNAEIGELDGRKTPRALRIAESFRRAGILGELTDDLLTIRWHKLMGNNGTNTVCTLGRCTVGAAIADPEGAALVRQLFIETVWVGSAEGAKLTEEQADMQLRANEQVSESEFDSSFDAAGLREGQAAGVRRDHRRDPQGGETTRNRGARDGNRARAAETPRRGNRRAMNPRMKILVMGAGAIGAYFGARLQQAGEDVVFCARGRNLQALKEHGLELKSPRGDFHGPVRATDNPREFAPYDLILFCVKMYDTDAAAQSLAGCLSPGGAILTLQNGVESESRLAEYFGRERSWQAVRAPASSWSRPARCFT